MATEKRNPEDIFNEAVEIADDAERRAYLDKACGDHPELRQEVEALLEAHVQAGDFLEAPPLDPNVTLDTAPLSVEPGMIIGRYKLLEKVGEGGMAVVYMAEQKQPIRRKVALKIIKLGMDTQQVIARFEAERQALAMMDHPNVAKVLDAGATEAGRPYFVMELVRGVSITEYCDQNKLSTKERLELFIPVCKAIQHAHHKGIVHRDLKPSNIMVTLHDGKPVPMVIDFGVAKATNQELTEKTLFTRFAQMIGTPEYMSPEQAEMSGLDIDARTDIYSLGVLLYELLTGTTPFGGEQLRQAGYAEIQRIIRETEPLKPSTRLSTLGQTLTNVAQQRQSSPETLSRLVRGDLDWIVMKTLEKDRTRRYETAHALAEDIERHLRDEPISAGRPSALSRCRKFVRRHRALVVATIVVLVVLIAGSVVSTLLAIGQARARAEAERQVQMSRTMSGFIRSLIGNAVRSAYLAANEESFQADVEAAVAVAMQKLEQRLDVFASEPLMEASVRTILAIWHGTFGDDEDALVQELSHVLDICEQQLGEEHPDTLLCITFLVEAYADADRYDDAEELGRRVLEIDQRKSGDTQLHMLSCMELLADVCAKQGRGDQAERLLLQVLQGKRHTLGEEHASTLRSMGSLAKFYQDQGRYDEAEPLRVRTTEYRRRILGEDDRQTIYSMNQLAWLYQEQARYKEARKLFRKIAETRRRILGEEHPRTLDSMNYLAWLHYLEGQCDEAERSFIMTLDRARRVHGEEHLQTLNSVNGLGFVYCRQGRYEEAAELLVKGLETSRRVLGEEDLLTLWFMKALGLLYVGQGRLDEAQPLLADTLDVRKRLLGEEHPRTLDSTNDFAVLCRDKGQVEQAERQFSHVLEARRKKLGHDHPDTLATMHELGALYTTLARYDEAEPLLTEAATGRRSKLGDQHPHTRETLRTLIALYETRGMPEEAEEWRAKTRVKVETEN